MAAQIDRSYLRKSRGQAVGWSVGQYSWRPAPLIRNPGKCFAVAEKFLTPSPSPCAQDEGSRVRSVVAQEAVFTRIPYERMIATRRGDRLPGELPPPRETPGVGLVPDDLGRFVALPDGSA